MTVRAQMLAASIGQGDGRLAAESVALMEQRLPDYLRQLDIHGQTPIAIARAAIAEIVDVVATIGRPLPRHIAKDASDLGRRRAQEGFPLESLLDADAVYREVVLRHVEMAVAEDPNAEETVSLVERRLDSHREQIILGVTRGYVAGHTEVFAREHRELAALMSIMWSVTRSLDASEIALAAVEETIRAMKLDQGALWLRDRSGRLVLLTAVGMSPDERATIGPEIEARGQVLEALEADLPVQGFITPTRRIFKGVRSVVTCALRAKADTIGVMSVGCIGEREFTEHEIAFVALISDHVGMALANAQQHVREARTDHFTGLANRVEFERAVQREVAAARRYKRPFTLMLLDLDHLKRFNDHFGHPVGDAAIKAVAEALKGVLRASDVSARLGGDEFGAAMPDAGIDEATEIAGRIRTALHDLTGELPERAGVSLGLATWEPPMDWKALWKLADERLYDDKRARRAEREGSLS